MQKALTQMNVMLHTVISDITGATGLKVVRSIVAGQCNHELLAAHRDSRCQPSREEIVAALSGNYREEHLFSLRQNLAAYHFHLEQIAQCDAAIEALLNALAAQQPSAALPPPRRKRYPKGHEPRFDIRTPLHRLTGGADLSQIDAIGPQAAPQLVAEIGTDMSRWPSPPFHLLAYASAQQQDLRRAPAQLQDSTFRQSHRRRLASLRDEPGPHPYCES